MRVRFWVTVLLLLTTVGAFAATRPPRELRLVGDHWTAYYPPDVSVFPPGSRVHIIERGDTLWALAQRYYGDPYLWPQLWENNTYITDAHWIYPGDPLLIEGEMHTGEVSTEPEVSVVEEIPMDDPAMAASLTPASAPIALGHESDIYCFGYLGHPDESLPNRIVSFEDYEVKWSARADVQENGVVDPDIIFVRLGDPEQVMAGETYIVVRPQEIVSHPETGATVGRHYGYSGRVRVLCINGDVATAMVEQACEPIRIGDAIKPLPEDPIPFARMTPMPTVCESENGKPRGHIVNAKDYNFVLGEGTVVEIDLGRNNLVEPGTFLTVYRESPIAGNPRLVLGEVGVLTAESTTATAQIVRMRFSMRVGDRVELK
ncbi:MAG TPA: LysM peptidoglycan-binding domain-containing protein [Thermoanaerobaculia bacterium]|nr:LysM peptidoglycan-binding domain-containing protein [Thermoanaerobaculia bacterium]